MLDAREVTCWMRKAAFRSLSSRNNINNANVFAKFCLKFDLGLEEDMVGSIPL